MSLPTPSSNMDLYLDYLNGNGNLEDLPQVNEFSSRGDRYLFNLCVNRYVTETQIQDVTTQLTVAEVTNVYTLDLAIKKSFTIDVTNATVKTIAFSNIPSDLDFAKPVTIKVICSVGNVISTYPSGIVWVDGVVPIFTIGKTYYLTFMRVTNGWHGACLGAF